MRCKMSKNIFPNHSTNEAKKAKYHWVIRDWAGNLMDFGAFKTFDDAEEFLCIKLDDNYETDRGEYEIIKERI